MKNEDVFIVHLFDLWWTTTYLHVYIYTTHSQMLGKVESGGGPIFKVVLEC